MRWISSYRQKPIKYVNVGDYAYYLGWRKPRKNEQFVTLNSYGEIQHTYRYINGEWRRKTDINEYFLNTGDKVNNFVHINPSDSTKGALAYTITEEKNIEVTVQGSSYILITGNAQQSDFSLKGTATASPEQGYVVDHWEKDDVEISGTQGVATINWDIKDNCEYMVVFAEETPVSYLTAKFIIEIASGQKLEEVVDYLTVRFSNGQKVEYTKNIEDGAIVITVEIIGVEDVKEIINENFVIQDYRIGSSNWYSIEQCLQTETGNELYCDGTILNTFDKYFASSENLISNLSIKIVTT